MSNRRIRLYGPQKAFCGPQDLIEHAHALGRCVNPLCEELHSRSRRLLLAAAARWRDAEERLQDRDERLQQAKELAEEALLIAQALGEFHGLAS